MKVERGGYSGANVVAYVIIGDGARDERVFEAIAEKFNHSKVVSIPRLPRGIKPLVGLPKTYGLKGLDGCINAIITCIEYTKVRTYICIIDREHVGPDEEVPKKLQKVLTERGFEIKNIRQLGDGAWLVKARRVAIEITLYIAILGFERCIEENIAKLINCIYRESVEPDKKSVNEWLKSHGLDDRKLVQQASKQILKETFLSLVTVIEELSQDPENNKTLSTDLR